MAAGKGKDGKKPENGAHGAAVRQEGESGESGADIMQPGAEGFRPAARLPVMIHGQYVKDLSFENPRAPESLRAKDGKPVMDINFSMDARKVDFEGQDVYEVTLGVHVNAKRADKTAFIAEIEYAVICSVHEKMPEEQVHPLLLIEMPRYAFPFVRQILASLTQQAGFMPLLLAPVDFRAFYIQHYGQKAAEMEKETAA